MNKVSILGALLVGVAGLVAASCSTKDTPAPGATGGQSTGGAPTAGTTATGGSGGEPLPFACGHFDASAELVEDGGLLRVGYTDPSKSVVLTEGGHYSMPNSDPDAGIDPDSGAVLPRFKGYCFTYDDKQGSHFYPPCGVPVADAAPPLCFTAATGLCMSANLAAGSTNTWGGGWGCNIGQPSGGSDFYVDVQGITSMTISVYGCKVPDELQVQLNVVNPPPADDAGKQGSGYFCKVAKLSDPDASGIRTATIQLADLQEDCWLKTGPMFQQSFNGTDPTYVRSMQAQINAPESGPTDWDFCVSKWTLQ